MYSSRKGKMKINDKRESWASVGCRTEVSDFGLFLQWIANSKARSVTVSLWSTERVPTSGRVSLPPPPVIFQATFPFVRFCLHFLLILIPLLIRGVSLSLPLRVRESWVCMVLSGIPEINSECVRFSPPLFCPPLLQFLMVPSCRGPESVRVAPHDASPWSAKRSRIKSWPSFIFFRTLARYSTWCFALTFQAVRLLARSCSATQRDVLSCYNRTTRAPTFRPWNWRIISSTS